MSQDLSPEVLRWNADRGSGHRCREYLLRDPWLKVSFLAADGTPLGFFEHHPENRRFELAGDHLMTFQHPCGHWFNLSPALLRAIQRCVTACNKV